MRAQVSDEHAELDACLRQAAAHRAVDRQVQQEWRWNITHGMRLIAA